MFPLEKVKVIDFSQRLPGPYCSEILADLGAEVIMVERSGSPPETRAVFPGLFELIHRILARAPSDQPLTIEWLIDELNKYRPRGEQQTLL